MPKFDFIAPSDEDLLPQETPSTGRPVASREIFEARSEEGAGVFKPAMQLINTLGSPYTKTQIFRGPINAVSQLSNAIGDVVQGKKVDVSDAWMISPQTTRNMVPFLWGLDLSEKTPADEAGEALGGVIGAEGVGFALTGGGSALLRHSPHVIGALNKIKQLPALRRAAVAARGGNKLVTTGASLATDGAKAVAGASVAIPFMDQSEGNLMNFFGENAPLAVVEDDDYFEALRKNMAVDGFLAPLTVVGLTKSISALRKGVADGGTDWLMGLGETELEPYIGRTSGAITDPARMLPAPKHDSAISRAIDEQTQIKQVEMQRDRLQDMGLVETGGQGQMQIAMPGVVDPEIKLQIRQLQAQRGLLIKASQEGDDVVQQLANVDQQIQELMPLGGKTPELKPVNPYIQPELELPDGRPEMDTMLARLDELDDGALRQMHTEVMAPRRAAQTAERMEQLQTVVDGNLDRVAEIQARLEAGQVTETGAKRLITKERKTLEAAQAELDEIQNRTAEPVKLVGDQLELSIDQQMALDLVDQPPMKTFEEVAQSKVRSGYKNAAEYRQALNQFPRDLLRRMTAPGQNPRVAALVKARTGRRVWQAKKSDIIDALVELSEREDRFLPPEMAQGDMALTMNQFGADAPLFELPADLTVQGRMVKMVDADGIEQTVPVSDFVRRGMDETTRESLKKEILQQAIENGEVQAPVTPLPKRPPIDFDQGSFIDDLLADGMQTELFSFDETPYYKGFATNSRGLEGLLEEIRLRYDFHRLDGFTQKAEYKTAKAMARWNEMTWEQQKALYNADGSGFEIPFLRSDFDAPSVVREPEPYNKLPKDAGKEKLTLTLPEPKTFRWTAKGLVEEGAPVAETAPEPAFNWFQRLMGKDPEYNASSGSLRQKLTRTKKPKLAGATPGQNTEVQATLARLQKLKADRLDKLRKTQAAAKGGSC